MNTSLARVLFLSVMAAAGLCGCVSKHVHCKFAHDVGAASVNYKAAATQANNPGWQAEADQLKQTVDSENQNYCK